MSSRTGRRDHGERGGGSTVQYYRFKTFVRPLFQSGVLLCTATGSQVTAPSSSVWFWILRLMQFVICQYVKIYLLCWRCTPRAVLTHAWPFCKCLLTFSERAIMMIDIFSRLVFPSSLSSLLKDSLSASSQWVTRTEGVQLKGWTSGGGRGRWLKSTNENHFKTPQVIVRAVILRSCYCVHGLQYCGASLCTFFVIYYRLLGPRLCLSVVLFIHHRITHIELLNCGLTTSCFNQLGFIICPLDLFF